MTPTPPAGQGHETYYFVQDEFPFVVRVPHGATGSTEELLEAAEFLPVYLVVARRIDHPDVVSLLRRRALETGLGDPMTGAELRERHTIIFGRLCLPAPLGQHALVRMVVAPEERGELVVPVLQSVLQHVVLNPPQAQVRLIVIMVDRLATLMRTIPAPSA